MTNKNHLVTNLEEMAALDKALWRAYRDSLASGLPPIMNPLRAFPAVEKLRKSGLLKWWQHYYAALIGALAFAIAGLFLSYWLLIGYAGLLYFAANFRSKYIEAYAFESIGRPEISKHAFGLETPSLLAAGIMEALRGDRVKIDALTLDSVIKLNKAAHEFEDVAFGVSDTVRKGLIGAPYALALWLFSTTVPIGEYLGQAQEALIKQPLVLSILIVFLSGFALLTYQLAFAGLVTKRDKKRYLLALNILKESYQERRK